MDRIFTNQYEQERARTSLRVSLIGLGLNVCLASLKITAGLISGSVSILADGINNLSDSGTVLVSMLSMNLARKPRDAGHPFGHGRLEYIGSLVIAIIVLYVGIDLLRTSIQAVIHPHPMIFSWWIIAATAVTIPVKLVMRYIYLKIGKKYRVATLMAAAQDSLNDILTTSAVLVGLLVLYFFGIVVDGYLGILVSVVILWSGFGLIRGTVNDLIGGKPDKELGEKILRIMKKHPEILGQHDFVLHDYGPGRSMASIHAEVSADADLLDIHDVVDQAEQEILQELNLPITIHMDPVIPDKDPRHGPKTQIEQYLANMNPPLSMHDFRLVPGKRQIKLIFDITIPAELKESEDSELIRKISTFAKSIDNRFECVIRIDRDYFTPLSE